MKFGCFPIGYRWSENLSKLLCGLLACRPLDAVDLRFALPGFGVDGEFYFGHVLSLIQNFTLILIVFPTRSLMRVPPSFLAIFRAAAS